MIDGRMDTDGHNRLESARAAWPQGHEAEEARQRLDAPHAEASHVLSREPSAEHRRGRWEQRFGDGLLGQRRRDGLRQSGLINSFRSLPGVK